MAKFALPQFIVVPDTNILFTPKPLFACSPFEESWKQGTQLTDLRLLIPEVVAEEILFRRHWEACRASENAAKSLRHLSAITNTESPELKTPEKLKEQIRGAFQQWLSNHRGQIVKTPIGKIQWDKVVESATWRLSPFSAYSPDKPDAEKGFRDCLILETFSDVLTAHPEQHIAILTGDTLLKSVTEVRAQGRPHVTVYSSFSELLSSLTLMSKNLKESFVKEIVAKAPALFYVPNVSGTLFYQEDVLGKIRHEFGTALDNPVEKIDSIADIILPVLMQIGHACMQRDPRILEAKCEFKPVSDDRVYFGPTSFVTAVQNRYSWATRIEVGRIFCDERMRAMGNAALGTKLRVASFDVAWSANISKDAEFTNCKVDSIKLIDQELTGCWSFTTERFGLNCESAQSVIQSLPASS
jgi:hypothetical protein